MAGFSLGSLWGGTVAGPDAGGRHLPVAVWSGHLTRATAALPVLLLAAGPGGRLLIWTAVLTGNAASGAIDAVHRQRRVVAFATSPWSPAVAVEAEGQAVLRVTGWPRAGQAGRWSAPATLLAWQTRSPVAEEGVPASVRDGILVTGLSPPPTPGSILTGSLQLRVPRVAALPGGFDDRQFLAGRGLRWRGTLSAHEELPGDAISAAGSDLLAPVHAAVLDRLQALLPPLEAHLVGAVLLGVRTPESREVSRSFGGLGLAHLFAVSGLHVGILAAIILLPGRAAGWGPRASALPLVLLIPLYAVLTGLPGSVVRAGGMCVLAVLARPCGRRPDPLRLLGLLYWAGAVLDPARLSDLGLQMSYFAAGGILAVSRRTDGFRFKSKRWLRPVLAGLAVSLAAQWFTLPLVAAGFGRISMLSPLANLVAVPTFGLAVWAVVLSLAVSPLSGEAASWLAALAWLGLRGLAAAASTASGFHGGWNLGLPSPGVAQVAGWAVVTWFWLVLLQVGGPAGRVRLVRGLAWVGLPCLLLWILGPAARSLPDSKAVVVWQYDVGQGDCALLVFPDGWTAMIDTGGRFNPRNQLSDGPLQREVIPFLERQGLRKLDAVLLTHGHLDHTGGATALAAAFEVKQWLVSGRAAEALAGLDSTATIDRPGADTVLHRWRDWEFLVLYPRPEQTGGRDENNQSLVAALRRGGANEFVWSGDLEREGEQHLLAAGGPGSARVWKAGHHGSETSGTPAFMTELAPELVLISCGVGNSYGHPSHGPYSWAGASGPDSSRSLRTDLDGSIYLRWSPQGRLTWRTMRTSSHSGPIP